MDLNSFTTLKRWFHTSVVASHIVIGIFSMVRCAQAIEDPFINESASIRHGYEMYIYFLSLWIVGINGVYYTMQTGIDVIEVFYSKNKQLIKYIENTHKLASYLLFTFVFPLSILSPLAYWTIYLNYPETIYDPKLEKYLPAWIFHYFTHGIHMPLAFVYMFTSNKYLPSKGSVSKGLAWFLSFYWALFIVVRIIKGRWVYLIGEQLPLSVILSLILAFIISAIYILVPFGYRVNSTFEAIKTQYKLSMKMSTKGQ